MKKLIILASFALFFSVAGVAQAAPIDITVLSPNGGEVYKEAQSIVIKWSAPSFDKNSKIQIYLKVDGSTALVPIAETKNIGRHNWKVKDISPFYDPVTEEVVYPNGKYKIVIACISDGCKKTRSLNSDESDTPFEIVSTKKQVATVRATFPKAGETIQAGSTYRVRWSGVYFPQNGKVAIRLIPSTLNQDEGNGSLFENSINNTGAVNWHVPTNLPAGKYRILVSCAIEGSEGACDNNSPSATDIGGEFTIIPTTAVNHVPSVQLSVDKNTVNVGDDTFFVYKITDADSGDRHGITIDHGDGSGSRIPCATHLSDNGIGKLNHIWLHPGVFKATVTIDDCRGGVATETQTITVGSQQIPFAVVTPNGGETLKRGTSYEIKWTADVPVNVYIQPVPCSAACSLLIINNVTNSYMWNVGTSNTAPTLVDGTYKIDICPATGGTCDSSDDIFTIQTPSVNSSEETNLQSCSSAAVYQFNVDLVLGDKGPEVHKLKCFLNAKGLLLGNYMNDYFGEKTKEALIAYQQMKGIIPATGYFGPLTRSAMNLDATNSPNAVGVMGAVMMVGSGSGNSTTTTASKFDLTPIYGTSSLFILGTTSTPVLNINLGI